MSLPIRHLPVLQNWDCHVCGNCCKEYQVTITDEERRRIEAQGWQNDPEVGDLPLFVKRGPWWRRRYQLNRRGDGSCVFLSPQGRCRIHERFGPETKPLPCRLFPFVLVPAGDQWRLGVRFACPSASASKGRPLSAHDNDLKTFASLLAQREGLDSKPGAQAVPPPPLQGRQRVDWPDLLRFAQALLEVVRQPGDRMERRLRKCLTLAGLCRQARFEQVRGQQLVEFLQLVRGALDSEVPADPAKVPPPGWMGRLLFRQAVALFARRDQGPNRGLAASGKRALLLAAYRFAQGHGPVPRLNAFLPETTFEQVEAAATALSVEAEDVLQRYYTVKVASLQFCGSTYFGVSFWDGLEALAVTFPVVCWLTRALRPKAGGEAVFQAVSLVDDHFGYNPVLGTARQRLSFRILARSGELARLIAWYGR
jgi:lysine-N-methylase